MIARVDTAPAHAAAAIERAAQRATRTGLPQWIAWRGDAPLRDGRDLDLDAVERVPTPDDIVALRRTDAGEVARWRAESRAALSAALDAGRPVVGFTREGEYLIGVDRIGAEG